MIEAVSITLLATGEGSEFPLLAAGSVDTRIHLISLADDGKVPLRNESHLLTLVDSVLYALTRPRRLD